MGKTMTFVVLAWLSVVLLLGAWMIAQSGRYTTGKSWTRLLDTHTGTFYILERNAPYKVWLCGPSDYFCEEYEPPHPAD